MNLAEYSRYDGTALGDLVRKGEITPRELAATALKAIGAVDPMLNAVIDIYREQIDGLDELSLPAGPFRGVPFLVKRIGISEKGKPMGDLGTRLLQEIDRPAAAYDSEIIARFRRSGLNILGHTTMPEMAYTISVESAHQGTTHNPWNPKAVAGGSSTGSAVAVAAGMVPMAHGSDAAGSTRFPASCNGVIGLKTTRGRVSLGPDLSDISHAKLSHFVVTRTVRDTAAMLDAVQGVSVGESVMYTPPERPFLQEVGAPTGKLRIALSNTRWHTQDVHPAVKAQLDAVGKQLEALGHHVTVGRPDIDFERYRECYRLIYYIEGALSVAKLADVAGGTLDTGKLQPLMRKIYEKGREFPVSDYADCFVFMNYLSRKLGQFFEQYDILLTPALSDVVPPLGAFSMEQPDLSADAFYDQLLGCNQYMPLSNLTGTPAISLPLCETDGNLPLGAHFMAPMGEDARLIRLAAQLEQAMPWRGRVPPTHVSRAS